MAQEVVLIGGTGIRSLGSMPLPPLFSSDVGTARRVIEFFTDNIRSTPT